MITALGPGTRHREGRGNWSFPARPLWRDSCFVIGIYLSQPLRHTDQNGEGRYGRDTSNPVRPTLQGPPNWTTVWPSRIGPGAGLSEDRPWHSTAGSASSSSIRWYWTFWSGRVCASWRASTACRGKLSRLCVHKYETAELTDEVIGRRAHRRIRRQDRRARG